MNQEVRVRQVLPAGSRTVINVRRSAKERFIELFGKQDLAEWQMFDELMAAYEQALQKDRDAKTTTALVA
jgi:hypothetical protein